MNEIKQHPVIQIYRQAENGNLGLARSQFASYINDFVNTSIKNPSDPRVRINPRGKIFDFSQGVDELIQTVAKETQKIAKTGNKKDAKLLSTKFFSIFSQVFMPGSHPIVKSAFDELETAYKEIYPNPQTRKKCNKICVKTSYKNIGMFEGVPKWLGYIVKMIKV